MSMTAAPCRLAVFLSRKSPAAVILRRGPSDWAQLVHWDRVSGAFTPGQWFHGRVYERRYDLSPDGRLFIYFATKRGRTPDPHGIGEAWTAISRPPYFTALALWPNLGSWYGGGVFKTDRRVLLDASCGLEAHPKFRPHRLEVEAIPGDTAPWEQRLLRDGWRLVERGFDPRTHRRVGAREIWEKPHPREDLKLCREVVDVDFGRFGGPYGDSYWIETADELIPLQGMRWADWEDWRHVLAVRDGRLLRIRFDGAKAAEAELFDFNPFAPEEVPTPDWAQKW